MKAILVGERPILLQRLTQLLERNGFAVWSSSYQDEVVQMLTNERYDLMLVAAPEDEAGILDLVTACKDVQPSLYVYVLTRDGDLSQMVPRLQPALGRKVSINDLPSLLREEIDRAEIEREQFRLESLRSVETVLGAAGSGDTIKEAVEQVIEQIHKSCQCAGSAIILTLDAKKGPNAVAKKGDDDLVTKPWKDGSAIAQWLSENQIPLLIRRGRSTIPGIQRDIVKYELGPCVFVPIVTTQYPAGVLAVTREPGGEPFTDTEFTYLQIAARVLAIRLESAQVGSSDEAREMLQHERERRQALEDQIGDVQDDVRRLAREIASLVDVRKGYRPDISETIAKLSIALAEQLEVHAEHLEGAVYLRDIGLLGGTGLAMAGMTQSTGEEGYTGEHARTSFEILSRVRLPSPFLEVARHHHENYDGSGGPDGLQGEDIPVLARIVRVVEDYVNFTVTGTGGSGSSPAAISALNDGSGRLYDAHVVDTFVRLIRAQGVTPEQETLSLIAHELRTPLTFLAGFSELLAARQDLPSQAKDMASELQKQTEQMVVLTERLLEISRLQSGRVSLSWQWTNLRDLVEEQVNQHRSVATTHTFNVELPPYSVRLRGDTTRLGQAVANLLTNAVKYSPNGGQISVRLEETPEEVVVSVADQGIGIPEDKLQRLFQPFYRVQDQQTRQIEGLGLGLALTRAVIEAHGGRIWAESQPGRGSVFSFAVPKQEAGVERRPTAGHART